MAMVKKTTQKKTVGRKTQTLIHPPTVKRVLSVPVTLQGWLHKRGSDGLMLWKKRWFVLSDYCLFYYKDSEEEKLLGSFFLASYIISPCSTEDKVYKKFSFKAEHCNMRTYYFAADNDVLMTQWVNALTMASLLQENPKPLGKINNFDVDNSDQFKPSNVDSGMYGDFQYGFGSSCSGQTENQPLYANAPPKPKRLNEAPSPDGTQEENRLGPESSSMYYKAIMATIQTQNYDRRSNIVGPQTSSPRTIQQPGPIPGKMGETPPNRIASPGGGDYECLRYFSTRPKTSSTVPPRPHSVDFLDYEQTHQQTSQLLPQPQKPVGHQTANADPKIITLPRRPKSSLSVTSPKEDYMELVHWSEESYARKMRESAMYVSPKMDPLGLVRSPPQWRGNRMSPINVEADATIPAPLLYRSSGSGLESSPDVPFFKRSASARLAEPQKETNVIYHPPLPAPILHSPSERSDPKKIQQREESMKRLLEWKQRMLQSPLTQKSATQLELHKVCLKNVPNDTMKSSDGKMEIFNLPNNAIAKEPESSSDINSNNSTEYAYASGPSERNYDKYAGSLPLQNGKIATGGSTNSGDDVKRTGDVNVMTETAAITNKSTYPIEAEEQQQMTPINSNVDLDNSSLKPASYTLKRGENFDEEWGLKLDESKVIKEFSYHYIKCDNVGGMPFSDRELDHLIHNNLRNRIKGNAKNRELTEKNTGIEHPSEREGNDPKSKALPIAGILKNSPRRRWAPDERERWESSEPHDQRQVFSDTGTHLYETSSDIDESKNADKHRAGVPLISSDDDRDDEVAAVLAKERHHMLTSCSLHNTPSNLTPTKKTADSYQEENYMPMTPRKRTVSATPTREVDGVTTVVTTPLPSASSNSLAPPISEIVEECPYVEMTQNGKGNKSGHSRSSGDLLNISDTPTYSDNKRAAGYDMTVYSEMTNQEPLYMEVNSVKEKNVNFKLTDSRFIERKGNAEIRDEHNIPTTLPDILNTSAQPFNVRSDRSDSSDADDEASKDLDSIDAPRHPRFSLSDTFRPASYYLGSSLSERAIIAMNSDHPDSSDSDLVSPPPIPASSPPLDDLDTSIDSMINNKDLSPSKNFESFSKKDKNDLLPSMKNASVVSSEEEEEEVSMNLRKSDVFLKRRPLSADILNSLRDLSVDIPPPPTGGKVSASDLESYEHESGRKRTCSYFSEPKSSGELSNYNVYRNKNLNLVYNVSPHHYGGQTGGNELNIINNSRLFKENNEARSSSNDGQEYINTNPSNFNQDHQSAPYYYSDLLKFDTRNNLYKLNAADLKENEQHYSSPMNVYTSDEHLIRANENRSKYTSHRDLKSTNTERDEKPLDFHRRSRSLEGLLDSTSKPSSGPAMYSPVAVMSNSSATGHYQNLPNAMCDTMPSAHHQTVQNNPCPPFNAAGPCATWMENSQWKDSLRKMSVRHTRSLEDLDKKTESGVTGGARAETMYANSDFTRQAYEMADHRSSTEKDREKIRQWDLMSSAPATLSSSPRDPNSAVKEAILPLPSSGAAAAFPPGAINSASSEPQRPPQNLLPSNYSDVKQRANAWNLKLSAGELLGRTHEELVLLLIQLRRQRASVCKSMERCHREIEAQACLTDFDSVNRLEHLQRLEELKSRLIELEKQYEKGKPLVNLVDNMVKLGSLYQSGSQSVAPHKLEFNHKVQEQRLLADERRDWERIRPDHQDLQAKVEQLYRLDKLLQEESGTLHSLQEDKGILERALGGLKTKLQGIHGNTAETEWYRRQQRLLERELSRVRSILALNSKKLEETVAENARLEQELVVLRQKLQLSRRTTEPGGNTTAALESELCRVQMLVGNLLRQRQELSLQVRQLTEKSNSLSQQIWSSPTQTTANSLTRKKHPNVGWAETDLDLDGPNTSRSGSVTSPSPREHLFHCSPLYVNTEAINGKRSQQMGDISSFSEDCPEDISPLTARSPDSYKQFEMEEDATKRSFGLNWKEKPQEIKTVRIVKRESERRQRDRDRSGNLGIPVASVNPKRAIPEEDFCCQPESKPDERKVCSDEVTEPPPTPGPRSDSVHAVWNILRKNKLKGNMFGGEIESPQLSPIYLSETARKIVEEVAWQSKTEKRAVPREKRRHHTVSGPQPIASLKHLFAQRGSRDDLDMERVLRPRLTTPDVVRSTLNRSDPSFTKETIDSILGAPTKILIPERYVPEAEPTPSQEELQKRSQKADAIRKMLCESSTVPPKDSEIPQRPTTLKHKVEEEKRNREHLLQLSQILAHEVMEKSKLVAVNALANLPPPIEEEDEEDFSPISELPLYQQRENFYS